jgi:hypothetical protein
MITSPYRACILAASLAACAGAARGDAVDVIFSRANGASSIVPGALDAAGNPVVAHFQGMFEFFLSPDGTRWIMRATSDQPTSVNQFLVRGGGLTGSAFLQKAQPFPGAPAGEVVNFPLGLNGYPFNANNDFAVGIRVTGNAQSFFCRILRYTGGVGAAMFQTGDPYVGAVDGILLGTSLDSFHLRGDGVIGWRDFTTGASFAHTPITVYNSIKFLQSNVDTVTTLDGLGTVGLSSIIGAGNFGDFLTSSDGALVVVRGLADLDGSLSNSSGDAAVVVVNGRIIAQVGLPLPGEASITPTSIDQTSIAPNNDLYMRGTYSGGAWATKNGSLIAKSGDAVGSHAWAFPLSSLQSSFYAIAGNSRGDWVIMGKTTNPTLETDDVVVVNGRVVLREGDPVPVDLDNDGVLDTAQVGRALYTSLAFPISSNNGQVGLAPDKSVYLLANLRTNDLFFDVAPFLDSAGYSLLRIRPRCLADFNNSGAVTVQDIFDFLAAYFSGDARADINASGTVTVQDIFDFLALYFSGCP